MQIGQFDEVFFLHAVQVGERLLGGVAALERNANQLTHCLVPSGPFSVSMHWCGRRPASTISRAPTCGTSPGCAARRNGLPTAAPLPRDAVGVPVTEANRAVVRNAVVSAVGDKLMKSHCLWKY